MNKLFKQEEQVEAMQTLLKHYKEIQKKKDEILMAMDYKYYSCPLCDVLAGNHDDSCSKCVWKVETGKKCGEYLMCNMEVDSISVPSLRDGWGYLQDREYRKVQERWVETRIEQLTKWIKKYS